ncbi:MAG: RNase P modulator RnpM [Thermomicrobiales bacterium]
MPQRMCVSCRERSAKRALIRLVRTPEGSVEVDPTGKRNGRGAYLCDDPACWERALSSGRLAQALKTTIDGETLQTLRRFAAELPPKADAESESAREGSDG